MIRADDFFPKPISENTVSKKAQHGEVIKFTVLSLAGGCKLITPYRFQSVKTEN